MGTMTYEKFCGSSDAQETVADALSMVIAEEYSQGMPFDATHTLKGQHCDVASWTLHYYFAQDGTTYTRPVISKHDIEVFSANGGVGWHALLEGLPGASLGKIIDPTASQFFDLVGLDPMSYEKVADDYPDLYPATRIAVFGRGQLSDFVTSMTDRAFAIASMTDRKFDKVCFRKTHGALVGQSREAIATVFSSIWDLQNYKPVMLLSGGHRERQTQRLARSMMRLIV